MNRMLRRSFAGAVMVGAALIASSAAADLTGKWHVSPVGPLDRFMDVVQTGSTVTFTFTFNGQPFGFIGTVNGADYLVYAEPMFCAALMGSVLPSGNTLDGNLVTGTPPTCYPYGTAEFAATRCTCFDGNTADGDGCSADCQVEPCFTCTGDPSICTPSGDGAACDDGSVCTTGETCSAGTCGGANPIVPSPVRRLAFAHRRRGLLEQSDRGRRQRDDRAARHRRDLRLRRRHTHLRRHDRSSNGGAFDARTANNCIGNLGFDPLTGMVASDGNSFSGSGYTIGPALTECMTLDTFVITGTRSTCGNGVIENGESCDDGNEVAGDGCDADCQVETCRACSAAPSVCGLAPIGTSCPGSDACATKACDAFGACAVASTVDCDDGHACTIDSCDPMLGCVHVPKVLACRSAGRSMLEIATPGSPAMDTLAWTWSKGQSTIQAEFADPRGTSTYAFCLFAGTTTAVVGEAVIPPDAQRWIQIGGTGFRFRDGSGAANGIRRVRLAGSTVDRAKIALAGKGAGLSIASLPLDLPLMAQLENEQTSVCWSASYAANNIFRERPTKLKAKLTSP